MLGYLPVWSLDTQHDHVVTVIREMALEPPVLNHISDVGPHILSYSATNRQIKSTTFIKQKHALSECELRTDS